MRTLISRFAKQIAIQQAFTKSILVVSYLIFANTCLAKAKFEIVDGLRYLLAQDDMTATLLYNANEPYSGNIIVPEKISVDDKEYTVTALAENCFVQCKGLTNVTIPASVTKMGDYCFRDCTNLTSIEIPASVTSMGDYCFYGCTNLTSIKIPTSVTSMGNYCFYGCTGLLNIDIAASITSLSYRCFSGCTNLSSIKIPTSVTKIWHYCFCDCTSLTSIEIPTSVTWLGSFCFENCTSLSNIKIPSSVTHLGAKCFSNCTNLSSIEIPTSVTSMEEGCFIDCTNLSSIKLSTSITQLEAYCFENCISLSSVEIPSSVTSLGKNCFENCTSLSNVEIPSSVTSLGSRCFANCSNLTSIKIPSSVTSIDNLCFFNCLKLESIYFGGSLPTMIISDFAPASLILYVPHLYLNDYKRKLGERFSYIYSWAPTGFDEDEVVEACSTPTISFVDGKLHLNCSTLGAIYHYTITDKDIVVDKLSMDDKVELSAAYTISVYATAYRHKASSKATATLYWISQENESSTNILRANTRGIVASSEGGIVRISGLNNGEMVHFYTTDGKMINSMQAVNGEVACAISEQMIIAKIGNKALKIAVK